MEAPPIVLAPANMSVSGIVMDEDGEPVAGAVVHASGEGQPRRQAATDADGKFTLTRLCQGSVGIYAASSFEGNLSGTTTAEAGETDVEIILAEDSSFRLMRQARQAQALRGKPLPDLKTLNVDLDQQDLKRKPLLVACFDVRQRPSRHFIKELAARADALREQGVAVVVLQMAAIETEALRALVDESALPFALHLAAEVSDKTRARWGVKALPAFILTDRDHVVRADQFTFNELDARLAEVVGAQ